MLVLDNSDAVRGIAEVASKLAFTVHGYVGTTATQLASGYIANTEGNLYASGADATVVTAITVVNIDSAARTFTIYFLESGGGTSWPISPVSLDLGIGYSFYTDGQRIVVMDATGSVITVATVHALGGSVHSADTLSNLNSKVSDATLVDTGDIVLKALFDANTVLAATSDDTPAAITIAEQRLLGRITSGNITALTAAQILTLINVTAGADVTGSNAPQAHKASHQAGDGDTLYVPRTYVWFVAGTVATGTEQGATFRMKRATTIEDIELHIKTAPTGAALIVDINDGGTTVFDEGDSGTRPEIDISGTTEDNNHAFSDTALAATTELTMDIDQVGSTEPGVDLTILLHCKEAVI